MSRREVTTYTCDIDGTDGTRVQFAIDGQGYEIDLCPWCKELMHQQLGDFLAVAWRATRRTAPLRDRSTAAEQERIDARAWARRRGFKVAERGRMPAGLVDDYRAANGGRP